MYLINGRVLSEALPANPARSHASSERLAFCHQFVRVGSLTSRSVDKGLEGITISISN